MRLGTISASLVREWCRIGMDCPLFAEMTYRPTGGPVDSREEFRQAFLSYNSGHTVDCVLIAEKCIHQSFYMFDN